MAATPYTWSHDPVSTKRLYEMFPQILGTGAKTAVPVDCRITFFRLLNPTAADITISVTDGRGTPNYLQAPDIIPAGGWIEYEDDGGGWPAYGGAIINTSASGIHAYLRSQVLTG